MVRTLVAVGPPVLAWAAVVVKLPAVRRSPGNPALRAFWTALVALAMSFTVLLPPVYFTVDRLLGIPNLARLLAHALALVNACAAQAFLLHLNFPRAVARRKVRRRGWGLAATLVLMTVLFTLAPVDQETMDFISRYGDLPRIQQYWLVLLAYLGLALADVARLSWRYAGLTDKDTLSLGLRVTAAGGVVGLGYVAYDGAHVVARRLGLGAPLGYEPAIAQALLAVAITLLVVGSTMPAWGPRLGLGTALRWRRRYRAYRRIYPLWLALCRATPEIALDPPRSPVADALTAGNLRFRLYRRVIEVWDGRLALRPFLDPGVADLAHRLACGAGLSGERRQAVVEAASLAAAVEAKAQGWRAPADASFEAPGGTSLDGEVDWLEKVALAYARSTVVRDVLAEQERHRRAAASGRCRPRPAP
jgi:hypothetical protein